VYTRTQHKCYYTGVTAIGCTNPHIELVKYRNNCLLGRHKAAHVRQQHTDRDRAHKGAFSAHVWAGEQTAGGVTVGEGKRGRNVVGSAE